MNQIEKLLKELSVLGVKITEKSFLYGLWDWFKVELTYTSNALEGNTLTRRETSLVVNEGLTVAGKSLVEHLEAKNHALALDWVFQRKDKKKAILAKDIFYLHGTLMRGIDDEHAGVLRAIPVRISGSRTVLPNPRKVPDLMENFEKTLLALDNKKSLSDILQAAFQIHYELVTIHPFVDGNGRTARLLMNLYLLQKELFPLIIGKKSRPAYLECLESCQTRGDNDSYQKFMSKSYESTLKNILQDQEREVPLSPQRLLKIGELAKLAKISVPTIRHYVELDLIRPAHITESKYQLFSEKTLQIIEKIKELKQERYSLKEIAKLL